MHSVSLIRLSSLKLIAVVVVGLWVNIVDVGLSVAQRNPERPLIEDLLPETTVTFLQISDTRDLVEAWQNGRFSEMFRDEEVAPLVDSVVTEGLAAYAKVEENVGLSMEELQSLPAGEIAFSIIAPRRRELQYMFVAEIGEENEAADKALARVRELMPAEGDAELETEIKVETFQVEDLTFYMVQREGLIVACTSEQEIGDFFQRWDGGEVKKVRPLSANRKFVTIMNRCKSQKELPSEMRYFVDPLGVAKAAGRGNIGVQAALGFLPLLGLDGLLGVGGTAIFGDEEYEMISRSHLLLANPKKGVLKMLALRPDSYEVQSWVPHDVHWYTATRWDLPQMYAELEKVVDLFSSEGNFAEQAEQSEEFLGLSFQEDLLKVLDGRISYASFTCNVELLNGTASVVGLGLEDADKAEEVLQKLFKKFNTDEGLGTEKGSYKEIDYWCANQEGLKASRERRTEGRRARAKRRDREFSEPPFRFPNPAIAIIDGVLVISDSIDALKRCIDANAEDVETLRNNSEFVETREHMLRLLGTDLPCAIGYNQPRHQFEAILKLAGSESIKKMVRAGAERDVPVLPALQKILDEDQLPDPEVLTKYLSPNGWFATSDDTGYHYLWFQKRVED